MSSPQFKDVKAVDTHILRLDITQQESQDLYRQWAHQGTYDVQAKDPSAWQGPVQLQAAVTEFITDRGALFLDVGAGTGLTGQAMKDLGFHNLHALEPLQEFVETAREKGVYANILQEFIGGDKPTSAPDDTYDVIITAGAFGPGHIPTSAVPEMVRIVKPGGHIIISMREEWLWLVPEYKDRLEPCMQRLEQDGKWTLLKKKTYQNHYANKDGILFVYRVS